MGLSLSTLTIHVTDFDSGTVELAIRRIESGMAPGLQGNLARHQADFYQIVWITGCTGEGKVRVDLDSYSLRPPMMCFFSPGQIRAWDIGAWQTGGRATGFVIGFTPEFFSNSPDDANALMQLPYFHGVGAEPVLYANEEQARRFTEVCSRLEREIQLAGAGQRTLLHSYMRILLIEARRVHQARPSAVHAQETAFLLTEKFLQLVEAHYLTTSSVADYAAKLHVTTNHLVDSVQGTMGQPAGKIVRERLLLEGARLLRYSDTPVADIAAYLNFEDPSYFSRFFKKHTGFSPSDFREQV